MRLKSSFAISNMLMLMTLAGCSSIPLAPPGNTEEVTTATVTETPVSRLPVVETLVSEALLRNTPIAPAAPLPGEEGGDDEKQPATPTIQMTANRVVERTINDYLQNRRGVLRTFAARGQIYFPMIEKIFAEEGVPDELKYLAVGESGLNPIAASPAGAVGMWQFMALTGRAEGLRVDSWVDERRDPEKATRAAARHLLALNRDYNGLWHLAVAGYNCSYRCITRAVKRAGGSMDNPPSYWDIYVNLPKETRDFVPKFIAASLILSNPEMYGIEVADFDQELTYDVVKIKGMLSLEEAARLAGTDLATIRNLNPALLRSTLPDDAEPYALKIPLGSYDRFVAAFERSAPTAAAGSGEYIVKNGDTLDRIARMHNTTVDTLREVNGISGSLIKINQKLSIPGMGGITNISIASTEREFVSYGKPQFKPIRLGEEFRLVHQSGSTEEKPLLAVSLVREQADEGVMSLVPTIYKVEPGDTLGSIARRFRVSVASIQQGNNLGNATIYPNQELTIHSATNISDAPTPESIATYKVQQGDSLYAIAARFGMSVDELKRLNRLSDNTIHPGQNLQVN